MKGPPLGPGGEDITWPDQVAPRSRRAPSNRKIEPQTSNLGSSYVPSFYSSNTLRRGTRSNDFLLQPALSGPC